MTILTKAHISMFCKYNRNAFGKRQFEKGMSVMANRNSCKRKWTADEVQQWYRDTGAFSYANPDDLNIIVKKPRREGLTVNWANPKAYLLQGAILAVVFAIIYLLK